MIAAGWLLPAWRAASGPGSISERRREPPAAGGLAVNVKALLAKHLGLSAKKSWGAEFPHQRQCLRGDRARDGRVAGRQDRRDRGGPRHADRSCSPTLSPMGGCSPSSAIATWWRSRAPKARHTRANVEIVETNALTFGTRRPKMAAGQKLSLAGNLPYQIASPLIFAMLSRGRAHLDRMVIMLPEGDGGSPHRRTRQRRVRRARRDGGALRRT